MKIAIVGATGTIGRPTADLLESRGHEVRRLSRSSSTFPVDLRTGAGLAEALADVDVVISAANGQPSGKGAGPVLVDGTRHLLEATPAHHLCVSIIGIEQVPMGYYRTKLAQEEVVKASGRPYTILRASQFHDLVGIPLQKLSRYRLALHSSVRLQPVDTADVAQAIAEVAEGDPRNATVTVAGPEIHTLSELNPRPGIPLPLPLPPKLRRPLKAGALTDASPDFRGTITYAQWLAKH
jgi:uncharacterized protein YbjT (DUF2867 family)